MLRRTLLKSILIAPFAFLGKQQQTETQDEELHLREKVIAPVTYDFRRNNDGTPYRHENGLHYKIKYEKGIIHAKFIVVDFKTKKDIVRYKIKFEGQEWHRETSYGRDELTKTGENSNG